MVKASETGALGAGTSSPEVRSNKPPAVRIEEVKARNVKVGEWLTLVAEVKDDGIPKPRDPSRVRRRAGPRPRLSRRRRRPARRPRNPAMSPPTRITVGKNLGLHVSWFVYRGAGKVTFDPPQVKPWEDTRAGANSPWAPLWAAPKLPEDGKLPVQVTFESRGPTCSAAVADDGALTSGEDVTIVVVP